MCHITVVVDQTVNADASAGGGSAKGASGKKSSSEKAEK
jgi:hypothetical protein